MQRIKKKEIEMKKEKMENMQFEKLSQQREKLF